jgi:hypothetical protein
MGIARKPEVMSPAGYWPQLEAAIDAGADAVYFGLRHFTARAKVGFSLGELPQAMAALHRRGARGFVTFNTLVFDHELREAARVLAAIAEAGADAIIVQDLGILKLARAIAPDLEIHASTQMSVTSAAGARLAQSRVASPWRASFLSPRCVPFAPKLPASWKYSFMARCAWLIPGSAFRARPGAAAALTAASARRLAACLTN